MGFWREESLVCLAEWLQSLLNYNPAGNQKKKQKNQARHAPVQRLEILEICMNNVTKACGILSKECGNPAQSCLDTDSASTFRRLHFLGLGPALPLQRDI